MFGRKKTRKDAAESANPANPEIKEAENAAQTASDVNAAPSNPTVKAAKRARLYKRLMITFIVTTVLFGAGLGAGIYMNYDYLAFKVLVAGNYIYTGTLDSIYSQQLGLTGVKNYYKNFDDAVIGIVSTEIRNVGGDPYTYLYTPPQYVMSQEATKTEAQTAEIKELNADWVYISLPNISFYTRDFVNENKEKLKSYKNIMIDLQSNHGGDLEALYDMAGLFLNKGMIIGKETARLNMFSTVIKAKKDAYFNFDNIVFLENGDTASAAEGFIMALRENLNNVTVIGTKSFGKGIGQLTMPLKSGYAVKATVIRIETPDGNSINGVGIEPDITYEDETNIVPFALSQFGY